MAIAAPRPAIPRTVWGLGFVSLCTDMGSEIVHALLPLLLAGPLGASATLIGLIEGAAEALVLVTKVFSGWLSDAVGRRKPLLLLGYGLAAAVKPVFPLADSVATITGARLLDRFGKGIRGAPRDAWVGDVAPPSIRGACYGLRQSLDTVGAIAGPLAAIALMAWFADDVRAVLWCAVLPGVVAVVLLLRLREPAHPRSVPARLPITRAGLAALGRPFWRLAAVGALLALARYSEAFLVLRAADLGLSWRWVPLVLVVLGVVYAASAYPAGRLSDRLPRTRLLMLSFVALAAANALLALDTGFMPLFAGIALWGLHLGLSQGIVAALVADVAPAAHRGSAFGVFNLVSGLGLLLASVGAGLLWDVFGPFATFVAGAALAGLAALLAPHAVAVPVRH